MTNSQSNSLNPMQRLRIRAAKEASLNRLIQWITIPVLVICLAGGLFAFYLARDRFPMETPLWERYTIDNTGQHILAYTVTRTIPQLRPPYYDGVMPLSFEVTLQPSPSSGGNIVRNIDVKHEFEKWTTIFIYTDPSDFATGSRTFNRSGQLLAEAIFEKANLQEGKGTILEVQYDAAGNVVFWCRSRIGLMSGFKTDEIEIHGTKVADYYFLWPVWTQ